MTIMMACQACRGDGVRVVTSHCHPATNVAGLLPYLDGGIIRTWRGLCTSCNGRGIIEWTRGQSLIPLAAANGQSAPPD